MDVSEIQSLIEELQSVSLDMDPEQLANTHKACAVLEDMAIERCMEATGLPAGALFFRSLCLMGGVGTCATEWPQPMVMFELTG